MAGTRSSGETDCGGQSERKESGSEKGRKQIIATSPEELMLSS